MSPYVLVLLAAPWFVSQAAPPATDADIRQAIEQLGADRAADREAATKKLWAIGKPAEKALREVLDSPDLEVVYRAKFLLEQIALGLGLDTPPETAERLRLVLHGDKQSRLKAAKELAASGQLARLVDVLKLEPDEALRNELLTESWRSGRSGMSALVARGELNTVQQLLELGIDTGDSSRDLAAFLHLTGRESSLAAKDSVQAYLLLTRGDTSGALAAADRAKLTDVRTGILFDRGDFKAIGSWHTQEGGVESLGYAAALHRLAGDRDALAADIHRLIDGDLKSDNPFDNRHRTILLLCDQFDAGLKPWPEITDTTRFDFLRYQGRHREALASRGVADPKQDVVAALKTLSPPGNDEEARNAVRFGWGLEIAELLNSLGEKERATALLGDLPPLVEKHLKRPQYMMRLAKAEFDLGLDERATARAAAAIDSSESVEYVGTLVPERSEAARLWWQFLRKHRSDAAQTATVGELRRLLLLRPTPLPADEFKVVAHAAANTVPDFEQKSRSAWLGAIVDACLAHGQRPLAVEIIEKQIGYAPVPARYLQGADLLAQEKRWSDAATWYRHAWEKDQTQLAAAYLEGYALQKAGQEAEGKQRIDLARLLPLADGEKRVWLASELRKRGLKDEANRECELVLALGPFDSSGTNDAAQQLGNAISGRDDLRCVSLWERLTVSLMASNRFVVKPEGYLQLRHVVNKVRVRGLLAAGKIDEAIEPARLALAAAPDEIELAIELCPKLEQAGRKDIADELFNGNYTANESVLQDFPKSSSHHNRLAWLSAKCNRRLDDALAHAKEAVKLAPKNAACQDTLAEVHFQRGEKEQAIAEAKRTLELAPGDKFFESQLKRFQESEPPRR